MSQWSMGTVVRFKHQGRDDAISLMFDPIQKRLRLGKIGLLGMTAGDKIQVDLFDPHEAISGVDPDYQNQTGLLQEGWNDISGLFKGATAATGLITILIGVSVEGKVVVPGVRLNLVLCMDAEERKEFALKCLEELPDRLKNDIKADPEKLEKYIQEFE